MASGGPEDTAQAVLRQAVGTLLDNFSFSSTSNESVDLLTDLARRFMVDCWKKGKTYAEHAGRTKLVPNDMNHAFKRMRFPVAELHDYVQQNGSVPALKPVTAFPVNKSLNRGVFAPTPSEQELEVRPEYIPSHFPATHPEWTNENADFLTMFKSGGAEKKQIADFPDFFSCSAQNLGLFQSKNRDPPEVVESEHVADHASLTGIMSSANIAAVRQEKAEAEKPPKIPKKKGRPRKLVEFAPREMTSAQPPTFHPNSLGEGTSSGTSSPLPPQLEVACAIKEKIKNKTKANKVDSPMPSLENCQNREDGEESNQSTSTDISSVPPVANSPTINQSTHPSLVPPLKRKYTKRHDKPLKVPKLAKKSDTGGGSLSGLKLPSMSKSFLEAQKKQLQMFEQEKLRKEARQAATQAAETQRRQQATEIQKAQKAALDMTIASMLIGVNAVNQNLMSGIDNNNAAVAALMLHNLLAANAQQQKKDTLHPLLNNLSNDASASASASASTSVQQSPAQNKNQAKSSLTTQNQQQPKLKLVFSKSNSNLAETSVRSVTEEEKTIPFAEEKIAEADQPSTSTANHLSSNNAAAATSVFGAQQVPDDSDSDTVPFVGGTALSPSEKSALVTTFPADLNESVPKLETPKKNDKPKKMNEEETPPMLNSVKNVDKERTKDKKKKRKKDKKKDSKDSSEKDRDHHHRSHKKKKKKHKRERDRSSDKKDRSNEREKEKKKEIETKPGKEKERKDDKKKNDSRPGTSQSIVLQISNKHSENPTSKKKESSSNYSPPEKIPKLELNDKDRESPKEPKLVVPLKIKLGGGIKSEKSVEVAQKEPETLKVAEKKEERIVPKLKLLTGFGIPAQVVTSVSNSNEKKSEKSSKSEPITVIEKKQPAVEFSKDPTPPPVLMKEKRRPGRPPGKSEKKLKADKEEDLKKEAKKKKSEFENDILKYVDGAELRRTSSSFEHDEKSSGEEEVEKEQIWICPACSIAYTEGANMVGCDSCDDWFHWHCVGLLVEPPENIPWYCPKCAKSKKAVKRPVSGSGKRPSELSTERKKSQVI